MLDPGEGRVEGMLDGTKDTKGSILRCELGSSVDVGLVLGWLDGTTETEGFSDGVEIGAADTLGNEDGEELGD